MATNAANAAVLWAMAPSADNCSGLFPITMSSRLVFNANPTSLGAGCILTAARGLAIAELDMRAISERMGSSSWMLDGLCRAILSPGEYQLDSVWASWVLVVYLCCHPEGRVLLRGTQLTDVDYQTATAFEAYGRAEITRRARLDQAQEQATSRKRRNTSTAAGSSSGDVDTPLESPDNVLSRLVEDEGKILAQKRKRGHRGCASASTSDSSGLLNWWFNALTCSNRNVLMSLIAHSKQAAREAATATLERQADGTEGVADNVVIRGISEQNAVLSAQALVPFVSRQPFQIPAILAWTWNGQAYRGLTRTSDEARSTTVHACYLGTATVQPMQRTQMRVAWSVASLKFAPRNDEFITLPGILERLHGASRMAERGKRGELMASRVGAMVLGEAEPPRPTSLSGVTRSTISVATRMTLHESQISIATDLAARMVDLKVDASGAGGSDASVPTIRAKEQDAASRREPLCSPATRLALGIGVNEELRTWMMGKTRKNDPCKVLLGITTAQERGRDAPAIINAEPPPLLTIVDFALELAPGGIQHLADAEAKGRNGGTGNVIPDVPFGMALHVCGDGAVRVPEMLNALHKELPVADFVSQARATTWAAMSQASYISNVGPVISAGFANSAIQSSKKISVCTCPLPTPHSPQPHVPFFVTQVCDNQRLLLLTPFDIYAAGMTNLEPSHLNTPYAGTYGCCFDHGVSAPGHMGHNYRSDKRQHGNTALSEEMADKLSIRFANAHWIRCSDGRHFCETPVTTRGVPHNLMPGVHSCLDEYLEALETLRQHTGHADNVTVDSLMGLPFGPWSQALAPVIEATADLSMRLCVRDPALLSVQSGKAYLPDCTPEEEAIVHEPLFRRPCQASLSDNPFATSYEHMDSFFNLANGIVLLCRVGMLETPSPVNNENPTSAMVERINAWVLHDQGVVLTNAAVCADILLMLSMMYPQKHGVAEDIVLPAWAEAVPAVQRTLAKQRDDGVAPVGAFFADLGLDEELVTQGRAWWKAFVRTGTGVWSQGPLGELLGLLDKHDGSHNVPRSKYAEVRSALERSVQAAWLVASPDGEAPPVEPHPAAEADSPERVRRPIIDPVFVGDTKRGIRQRGCLVGLKPHQLRQVCALAMGAHLPDVKCQASRNEGARICY